MQLVYNSENFAVLQFEMPATQPLVQQAEPDGPALAVTGFEIVDKLARREVFLQGALAERFRAGVQTLAESGPSQDQFDDFISGFASAATQSVSLH